MAVQVFFVDLRNGMSEYKKTNIQWYSGIKAFDALNKVLAPAVVEGIVADLAQNYPYLTISWNSRQAEDHSDIGGVGSLDWLIENDSMLTVIYEDENTTEHQVDESSKWLLENAS